MKLLRLLAFPITILYAVVIWLRNKAFDFGIIPVYRPDIPVINVGNLSTGGTGKTPHIEYITKLLQNDFKVAILSRGYKRVSEGFLEANKESRVFEVGDEPLQFYKKFKDVVVAVDEKRKRGIKKIMEAHPDVQVILLDDAFQHRFVKPGLNILLTTYTKLYIDDLLLPTGDLREPASSSKRADIIIISKSPKVLSPLDIRRIKTHLRPRSYQNIYFSYQSYEKLQPLTEACKSIDIDKKGANFSVFLITGIAHSDPLKSHLIRHFSEVKEIRYPDHYLYDILDIKDIEKQFNDFFPPNKFIITTEKDAMRLMLPDLKKILDKIPVFYLPIEAKLHDKHKDFFNEQIINYVRTGRNHTLDKKSNDDSA